MDIRKTITVSISINTHTDDGEVSKDAIAQYNHWCNLAKGCSADFPFNVTLKKCVITGMAFDVDSFDPQYNSLNVSLMAEKITDEA